MGRAAKITEYHGYTGNERANSYPSAMFPLERETLCGSWEIARAPENRSGYETTRTALDATCRACAKAYGKAELKKVSGRITIEKLDGNIGGTKTFLIVSVDGVRRAVVSFPTGWGGHWELHAFSQAGFDRHIESKDRGEGGYVYGIRRDRLSGKIDSDFWSSHDVAKLAELPAYAVRNIHRMAQEAMVSLVPALTDAGKLPTDDERRAAEAAEKEARAVRDAERQAQRDKDQEERDRLAAIRTAERQHARDALASILEKHGGVGGDLSNFDAEGLALAIKLL